MTNWLLKLLADLAWQGQRAIAGAGRALKPLAVLPLCLLNPVILIVCVVAMIPAYIVFQVNEAERLMREAVAASEAGEVLCRDGFMVVPSLAFTYRAGGAERVSVSRQAVATVRIEDGLTEIGFGGERRAAVRTAASHRGAVMACLLGGAVTEEDTA